MGVRPFLAVLIQNQERRQVGVLSLGSEGS